MIHGVLSFASVCRAMVRQIPIGLPDSVWPIGIDDSALAHRDGRPRRRGAAASATAWGSMPSVERRARVNNSLSV